MSNENDNNENDNLPEEPKVDETVELPEDTETEENVTLSDNELDYGDDDSDKKEKKSEKVGVNKIKVTERHHKAVLEKDITLEKPRGKEKGSLAIPCDFSDKIADAFFRVSKTHIEESKELLKWATVLQDSMDISTVSEALSTTMDDLESEWYQALEVNGKELAVTDIKPKKNSNAPITGERAVLLAMRHLKSGSVIQVPLFHSGIWVTIITPKESAVIDLYRAMDDDIVTMGRNTNGLIYSNMSVIVARHVLGFIEDHIKNTSCDVPQDVNIMEVISIKDLYPLINGILCAMHPNGKMYERSCITEGCGTVEENRIDLRKITWVNRKALTEEHKLHMLKRRPNSMTMVEVKNYQDTLVKTSERTIEISSDSGSISMFTFKTPTLSKFMDYGEKWVMEIEDMTENAIDSEVSSKDKTLYMQRHAQASILRQYGHWVSSIEIEDNVVDTEESINKILSVYSNDDTARENFLEEIANYIDTTTISLVGIPTYDCPVCKKPQNENNKNSGFVNIVPIDALLTFFTLAGTMMLRIAER